MINQKWDELIKSINNNLEAVVNKLKDKQNQMMEKLRLRKEEELRKYWSKQRAKSKNNKTEKSMEGSSFLGGI